MEKDLQEFVDSRINNSFTELKKDTSWKSANKKFEDKYNKLYTVLPEKEKSILEDVRALFFNLTSEEQYLIYKIGFYDGVTFKSDLKKVARI